MLKQLPFYILLLCVTTSLSAQKKDFSYLTQLQGKSLIELKAWEEPTSQSFQFLPQSFYAIDFLTEVQQSPDLEVNSTPSAYSYKDLAFFCKLEVKMEKKAKIPIKFRLGEVQYVERMEGKY